MRAIKYTIRDGKMVIPTQGGGKIGCCCTPVFCHDKYGATIHSALSGVTLCSGCLTVSLPDASVRDVEYSFTGINGMAVPTWDGTNWVAPAVGTGTITVYNSNDGTCSGGVLEAKTGDLNLTVSCSGENQMGAFVKGTIPLDLGATEFIAYESVNVYTFGDPMPNFRTIAFCGASNPGIGVYAAYDGTLSLSL